jgi:deoxyribonucleoside regulator
VAVKSARTNVQTELGDALLVEIAQAYYERSLTQQQVAGLFGISRSQISRYLQEARERDIVQIRVVKPGARSTRLEAALKAHFPHLHDVVVAAVFSDDERIRRRAVANEAAQLLERVVRPNTTVCFGAGRTLAYAVSMLKPRRLTGVTVVQAMGNAGHEGLNIDYNAVASTAAAAFGGRAVQINAPAIVGLGMRSADLEASNPQIRDAVAVARSADIFLVGIGSMSGDQIYVQTGLVSLDDLAEAKAAGAVGDICGNFFNITGRQRPGPFAERAVGIRLSDLASARLAIGCASGSEKVAPIVGALKGRFLNVVVTDELTAAGVLELVGGEAPK